MWGSGAIVAIRNNARLRRGPGGYFKRQVGKPLIEADGGEPLVISPARRRQLRAVLRRERHRERMYWAISLSVGVLVFTYLFWDTILFLLRQWPWI